jgi:hypothetical protein
MKPNENQGLEQILESAVVVSWTDLMPGTSTGLIHIEYGLARAEKPRITDMKLRTQWSR